MKSKLQSGVALVITLLMLSVITFMTVAFLAVSRRDRAAVTVSLNDKDARAMADAALARAQSEIVTGITTTSNLLNYDLMISKNYINENGFFNANRTLSEYTSVTNVNYDFVRNGAALPEDDRVQNIANLFLDPRPPVFVKTNSTSSNLDFRFWIDMNRNGRFETNGLLAVRTNNNDAIQIDGTNVLEVFNGEPQWVGVLKNPEYRHSASNQFIGRYAYMVLPIGKTLDLNYIHNYAGANAAGIGIVRDATTMPNDFYKRDQGFGSWEINLAAYLRDLNPRYYTNSALAALYSYRNEEYNFNSGDCFIDANALLRYRYNGSAYNLPPVGHFSSLGPVAAELFKSDTIDGYSTHSRFSPLNYTPAADPDITPYEVISKPWPGSDNPNVFYDPQELFDSRKSNSKFVSNLKRTGPGQTNNSTDRYMFQTLLASMGTDSAPELKDKININYTNNPAVNTSQTNFADWPAIQFFTNTADLMLRKEFGFGIDAIPIYTTNVTVTREGGIYVTNYAGTYLYKPAYHRLLQLAANIYDATTNSELPSVFRPIFTSYDGTNFISGFTNDLNPRFYANVWNNYNKYPLANTGTTYRGNVFGVPVVIGAKKNLPNFNELTVANTLLISRKFEFVREAIDKPAHQTNQAYYFCASNAVGVELWNSYRQNVKWDITIITSNYFNVTITNDAGLRTNYQYAVGTNISRWPASNPWLGSATIDSTNGFIVPILNVTNFLQSSAYREKTFTPPVLDGNIKDSNTNFDRGMGLPIHKWGYNVTNRFFCTVIATDDTGEHVIDFVSLSTGRAIDVLAEMNRAGGFWQTNGGGFGKNTRLVSEGIKAQIRAYDDEIRNFIEGSDTRTKSLSVFGTNAVFQMVSFDTYQANDPLVHYTKDDLKKPGTDLPIEPYDKGPVDLLTKLQGGTAVDGSIGTYNKNIYKPWRFNGAEGEMIFNDPNVWRSDDWQFPTNKFPSVGWLGRVHRGTPWQTVFLKADPGNATNVVEWKNKWAMTTETYPTNDWRLVDLFTVAPNDNAARGLLSVNQTNLAPWSAVLSGVVALRNSTTPVVIHPKDLPYIMEDTVTGNVTNKGINTVRRLKKDGLFQNTGDVLEAPTLTVTSPFINNPAVDTNVTDAVVERIPQQTLSLLKLGQPRFVIYAYGQSLKPAENGIYLPTSLLGSPHMGLCTNYQITGETLTRMVCHVEAVNGNAKKPKIVVDSYNIVGEQP